MQTPAQMKRAQVRRLGLVGGMSWHSTALYYERLNRALEAAVGPHTSFAGHIWNLDYTELIAAAGRQDWLTIENRLTAAVRGLTQSGCDVIALTAVTAHRWYDAVCHSGITVPHVLDAAARKLDRLGVRAVGVLGTALTCASDFTRTRLSGSGRSVLVLEAARQAAIDTLIHSVLTAGRDPAGGRDVLRDATRDLRARGADAVVLACTELPLLLPVDLDLPLIDCVALHTDDICNHILSVPNA